MSNSGPVAIVTGSGGGETGGIGSGIARVLARRGYTIAVNDVNDDLAAATVDVIRAAGGSAAAHVFDVTNAQAVNAAVQAIVEQHGGLDVVVNNAGIVGKHSVANTPDDEWNRVVAINLTGPFMVARAAIPALRQSANGRIINIASIAGIRIGQLGGAVYTATKSGILGFTRHLAVELGPEGITVNAICPGLTLTPLITRGTTPETLADIKASVPTQTAGTPEDIGELVAFLASPAAHYITGEAIVHDGGKTLMQGDYTSWFAAARPIMT